MGAHETAWRATHLLAVPPCLTVFLVMLAGGVAAGMPSVFELFYARGGDGELPQL